MKPFKEYDMDKNAARLPQEALDEVQREIEVRMRLYDDWVKAGKISYSDAHDRLERMLSAYRLLAGGLEAAGLIEENKEIETPAF